MKLNIKSKTKGFSLMEVVMVIGIIAIMTAIGLIAVQSSRSKTALEAAANEVMASLRETQNYALTGRLADEAEKCSAYVFSTTDGSENYSISGLDCSSFRIDQKLSGGVVFLGDSSVSFISPHGDISGATTILLSKGDYTYYVCINNVGKITKSSTDCY